MPSYGSTEFFIDIHSVDGPSIVDVDEKRFLLQQYSAGSEPCTISSTEKPGENVRVVGMGT